MHRATFTIANPDDMQATMTLTMTVKEWRELSKQLSSAWPSWQLSSDINDLIRQAHKVYYPEQPHD